MPHGALWAACWVGSQVIVGFFAYFRGRHDEASEWLDWLNAWGKRR
jgi:hypothetical protein